MIPATIHQIWIGPKAMPAQCVEFCRRLREMHPGWSYRLHGNELFRRYASDPLLKTQLALAVPWAFISDRLRTLLLFDEGGAYVDVDCEPLAPLDIVHETYPDSEFISSRFPGSPDTDVTVLFSARHSEPAGEMIRSIDRPHRTGRAMLDLLNNFPGVTLAPSHWWYARTRDEAVLLWHQGHRLRSWLPLPTPGVAQEWAVILRSRDGSLHLHAAAPERRNLVSVLEGIDLDHWAEAGIYRITKNTANKFRRRA